MDYFHELRLAPTKQMLDDYKKGRITWDEYERLFLALMSKRRVESGILQETLDNSVLLCSEAHADHCHRRLVAEYLSRHWGGMTIEHL